MAVAEPVSSPPIVHPETERLLLLDCWTDDPCVAVLEATIHTLLSLGDRLRTLSVERPAIDRLIADDIGALCCAAIESGRVNVWRRQLRPSGLIAALWNELDALRHRWITARLKAEGLDAKRADIAL